MIDVCVLTSLAVVAPRAISRVVTGLLLIWVAGMLVI